MSGSALVSPAKSFAGDPQLTCESTQASKIAANETRKAEQEQCVTKRRKRSAVEVKGEAEVFEKEEAV